MIYITVAICTHNRKDLLQMAIESLINQSLPKEKYEILIIDNCSQDSTEQYIKNLQKDMPNLRYLYQPILGVSASRNAGWKNAKGNIVAYLDDDEIAASDWLKIIYETFKLNNQLQWLGGKIELIWETKKPNWLHDELLAPLGQLNLSENPRFLTTKEYVGVGNSAFRKNVLAELKGFDENLGRKGQNLLSNEEILLKLQFQEKGIRIYYHPKMLIYNWINKERLTQKWFIRRFFWQGISDAKTYRIIHKKRKKQIIKYIKTLVKRLFTVRFYKILIRKSDSELQFLEKCKLYKFLGYIYGMLR